MAILLIILWIVVGIGCCEYYRQHDPENIATVLDSILYGIIIGPVAISFLFELPRRIK